VPEIADYHQPKDDHEVVQLDGRSIGVRVRRGTVRTQRVPVILLHGATLASELFCAGPASWMRAVGDLGYPVYAPDMPGYGDSTFATSSTFDSSAKTLRATDLVTMIGELISWVCHREQSDGVTLVGASWGSITAGIYASATRSAKLEGLVLYAPFYGVLNPYGLLWLSTQGLEFLPEAHATAFREFSFADFEKRWMGETLHLTRKPLVEEEVRAAIDRSLASRTDAVKCVSKPGTVCVPNGCLYDLYETFSGRKPYDATKISCNTLLLSGAEDQLSTAEDRAALLRDLGDSASSVVVSPGGHFALLEKHRLFLTGALQSFLRSCEVERAENA
jgi:pimeloyl-ACP methyl ester carboxylesterase